MVELTMNRSRSMAEGVVVMICPVLLVLALNKVDVNGEAPGHGVPAATIVVAGITLITGIFPLLACCFSEAFLGPDVSSHSMAAILATTLSSSFLLALASIIAHLLVTEAVAIATGVVFGVCVLARGARLYCSRPQDAGGDYTPEMHRILDESHEFLTGVTGILFLGFEGLALEGHGGRMVQKVPVGAISFAFCALGVCLMFLVMTPPACFAAMGDIEGKRQVVRFTLALDCAMAAGTLAVLVVVMLNLMQVIPLLLFVPPVFIVGWLVLQVAIGVNPTGGGGGQPPPESTPASLELTRVTFTGFLAVSVTAMSNASPSKVTVWFLLFAAAAIVFGLSWRLLSQMHVRSLLSPDDAAASAKLAAFCAHVCIVIATVLFLVMAGRATGK